MELEPIGKLTFVAGKNWLPAGLRSEWIETDKSPMESLLPEIIAGVVTASQVLAERTKERQEQDRKWRIAEQQRREEEARRKEENNRRRRFIELARQWQDFKIAHEFLAALKALPTDLDKEVAGKSARDWLTWAEERLVAGDPAQRGVEGVFADVGEVKSWTYND